MTRRVQRIALSALACAAVLLGGLWLSFFRARQANDTAMGAVNLQRRALADSLRQLEARLENAERTQRSAAGGSTLSSSEPAAVGKTSPAPRLRTQSDIIASSPALELLELERQRSATNQEYDRLFRQLGLTAEQIARFCELKVHYAELWMDLRAASRTPEVGEKTTGELQAKATLEHEAALAALLGPEGYRRLQEFTAAIPAHNVVVRGLAGAAALDGVPLTPEQGERLLAAAVNTNRAPTPDGRIELREVDWDALGAAAQRILTPAQYALFKNVEPPSGFQGYQKHQLDAAIQRALDAERATAAVGPVTPGK